MKIELVEMKVRDVADGYEDNAEEGVVGFGGRLNIRPAYQREFVYKDKERDAVINTIQKGFPLNVMYWMLSAGSYELQKDGDEMKVILSDDARFELLDGQQRTISICQYITGDFSIDEKFFHSLTETKKEEILNYKLMIYFCQGNDDERLNWFRTINIAGEKLTQQELRNATFTGPWVSDAKRYFSKNGCAAYKIGVDYMSSSRKCIRQEYLETAIDWIARTENITIDKYMSKHQHEPNASALWQYYQSVINWVKTTFPKYRKKEMQGVQWGILYNKYKNEPLNAEDLEKEISILMADKDITNPSGIYEYVLDRDERHLSIRAFDDDMKRIAYENQKGICKKCGKHFEIYEMEADHIDPWSKGGRTIAENCQMLCKHCNRIKSDV